MRSRKNFLPPIDRKAELARRHLADFDLCFRPFLLKLYQCRRVRLHLPACGDYLLLAFKILIHSQRKRSDDQRASCRDTVADLR